MNQKALIAAAAVMAGAAGMWLWVEQSQPHQGFQPSDFEFPRLEGVSEIDITCSDAAISLRRVDNAWTVTAPYEFEANSAFVSRIAEVFADRRVVDRTRSADDRQAVGLGADAIRLRVSGTNGEFAANIGATVGVEQTVRELTWVVPDGSTTAYRVGSDLRSRLSCDPERYREMMLVTWNASDITAVELPMSASNPTRGTVRRSGESWQWDEPGATSFVLDAGRIDRLVSGITRASATRAAANVDAVEAGIAAGAQSIVLFKGDERITLLLGNQVESQEGSSEGTPAERFLRVEGEDMTWVVSDTIAGHVAQTLEGLRSPSVTDLARDAVASVEVRRGPDVFTLTRSSCEETEAGCVEGGRWQLTGVSEPGVPNAESAQSLVDAATRLRSTRWLSDAPADVVAALSTPGLILTILAQDGSARIIEMAAVTGADGQTNYFGRVPGEDLFEMSEATWQQLNRSESDLL
jgi:hypothetical protein